MLGMIYGVGHDNCVCSYTHCMSYDESSGIKKQFHGLMHPHMLKVAGSAVFLGEEGCARVELPRGAFRALG